MKFLSMIFAALGALLLLAAVLLAVHAEMLPWYLYDFMGPITKLATLLLVAAVVALLFIPADRAGETLLIFMWISLGIGAAASALDLLSTWQAVQATQTHNLKIIGPGLAGGLLPLALGLLAAAVAAFRISRARAGWSDPAAA